MDRKKWEDLCKEMLDLIENNPEIEYYSQRMDRNINDCPSVTKGEKSENIKEEMEEECGNRQPVRLKFGYSYLREKNGSLLSFSDWKQQADDMLCSNK